MEEPNRENVIINVTTEPEAESEPEAEPEAETEKPIELLKENIKMIEKTLDCMKAQLNSIEKTVIKKENTTTTTTNNNTVTHAVLLQPKIKDTSFFNGGKPNKAAKKIKMDIGFNIQRLITPELCDFMKLEKGSMTTLNEATKTIMNYISEHKLQDTSNPVRRKYIIADEILSQLFNLGDKDEKNNLTYFNLAKYIYPHFTD
jgi:chromatin remodeling complex protein RSC6